MNDISIGTLFIILFVLILMSAFFSGSETALMTLNRYRLKNLAQQGHKGALLAEKLLARPDRLLGLILLGNNLVNIMAASIATVIAIRMFGDAGIAISTFLLTVVILVFAEVAPKTMAALHPQRFAFPAAFVYTPLLFISYPLIWLINKISNAVLLLFGVNINSTNKDSLNTDELRTVVSEAKQFIPGKHSDMLLGILDLEKINVDDIMIPRNEVTGIDINDEWQDVVHQITHSQRTRVPVFRDSIDNTMGMLHLRKVLNLFARDELNIETLEQHIREAYFIPEGTSLMRQLLNFQKNKRRSGLVVDEYGSILGLVTMEDILEEIVGKFTTDSPVRSINIHQLENEYYLIEGGVHIRDINRSLSWSLPTDGPKTLNGLILEHLEMIPKPGISLKISDYQIEITKTNKNAVQAAKIRMNKQAETDEMKSDDIDDK